MPPLPSFLYTQSSLARPSSRPHGPPPPSPKLPSRPRSAPPTIQLNTKARSRSLPSKKIRSVAVIKTARPRSTRAAPSAHVTASPPTSPNTAADNRKTTSLEQLLLALFDATRKPDYASDPVAAVRPILNSVRSLSAENHHSLAKLIKPLMASATRVEDGIELTEWVHRVLEGSRRDEIVRDLLAGTLVELAALAERCHRAPYQTPQPKAVVPDPERPFDPHARSTKPPSFLSRRSLRRKKATPDPPYIRPLVDPVFGVRSPLAISLLPSPPPPQPLRLRPIAPAPLIRSPAPALIATHTPSPHPHGSIRNLEPILRDVASIEISAPSRLVDLADSLLKQTSTVREGVEVAAWLLRVTRPEPSLSFVRRTVLHALVSAMPRWQPRPAPDLICGLARSHPFVDLATSPQPHPLVGLVEFYTRSLHADHAVEAEVECPSPLVMAELATRRREHVEAVKTIERAMRFVGGQAFGPKSCISLMRAYAAGSSFEDVRQIWEIVEIGMRGEKGRMKENATRIYMEACAASGHLDHLLDIYDFILSSPIPEISRYTHQTYHQSLVRLGAWQQLVESYTRSLSLLTVEGIVADLRLAGRMADHPARYCTDNLVDKEACELLLGEVREAIGKKMWSKVAKVLWATGQSVAIEPYRTIPRKNVADPD